MDPVSKAKFFSIPAVVFNFWFMITGWIWPWLFNIFFSLPFGLLGLLLWFISSRIDKTNRVNILALNFFKIGVGLSLGFLIVFFITSYFKG